MHTVNVNSIRLGLPARAPRARSPRATGARRVVATRPASTRHRQRPLPRPVHLRPLELPRSAELIRSSSPPCRRVARGFERLLEAGRQPLHLRQAGGRRRSGWRAQSGRRQGSGCAPPRSAGRGDGGRRAPAHGAGQAGRPRPHGRDGPGRPTVGAPSRARRGAAAPSRAPRGGAPAAAARARGSSCDAKRRNGGNACSATQNAQIRPTRSASWRSIDPEGIGRRGGKRSARFEARQVG